MQTCQPSSFWRDSPAFLPDVPLNHGNVPLFVRSRIFFCARAICNPLPRCLDVNTNHPIERNYGNSVRFLAKIPNGTAAESPCYSVFWNAIDLCRLYTSKKISMWALPTVPLFAGKSRFLREMSLLKHSPGWQVCIWKIQEIGSTTSQKEGVFALIQALYEKQSAIVRWNGSHGFLHSEGRTADSRTRRRYWRKINIKFTVRRRHSTVR